MHLARPAAPFTPEFFQDPYPTYAWLRDNDPVCAVRLPDSGIRVWLISRYEDVRQALADSRYSANLRSADASYTGFVPPFGNLDPPEHTRVRRFSAGAFTVRRLERYGETVARLTQELLAALPENEQVDLLRSFAYPLSISVIAEFLGAPLSDHDDLRRWAEESVSMEEPIRAAGALALQEYARSLVANVRSTPTNGLVAELIAMSDRDGLLTEQEIVDHVTGLIFAGQHNTSDALGNGLLALLNHPRQWQGVQANPGLVDSAVEEMLRYEGSSWTSLIRIPTQNIELHHTVIPRGDLVFLVFGAANRDPQAFIDPEVFDITRSAANHFGFGRGIHYCVGANLAKLQMRTAIASIISQFPAMRLAVPRDAIRYRPALVNRGLRSLPVHTGHRAAPHTSVPGASLVCPAHSSPVSKG
ncbi:cytochrome P450 [Streptomyces sp. NPDC005805]|uniref:cytochrome P450 n=1 Tax=Streptomyces sp. NPDC005805 TaxID=3157068 RepID=UPI003402157F